MCSYVVFYVLKKYKHTYTVLTTIRCIYTSRPRRRSTQGKDSPSLVAPMGDRRGTLAATRLGPLVLLPPLLIHRTVSPSKARALATTWTPLPPQAEDLTWADVAGEGGTLGEGRGGEVVSAAAWWLRGAMTCLWWGAVAAPYRPPSPAAGGAGLALVVEAWHGWWQRRRQRLLVQARAAAAAASDTAWKG
jgi:hypothetical protein